MVMKIMVEVLGVLALATKQINQGRLSESTAFDLMMTHGLTRPREICKEATRRERHRIGAPKAGQALPRGVENDRCPDSGRCPWPSQQHGGNNGRCVSLPRMGVCMT